MASAVRGLNVSRGNDFLNCTVATSWDNDERRKALSWRCKVALCCPPVLGISFISVAVALPSDPSRPL